MIIDDKTIKRLRETEMEILDDFQEFCRIHELTYSLIYGSVLGAVRHKGFIPWDDDLDVCMPRADYDRFLKLWEEAPVEGYVILNKYTNDTFSQNFTKIRKDHTAFLHNEEEAKETYHKGIFLDIFPVDYVAPGKLSRKIQYAVCAVNLLYCREFTSGAKGFQGLFEKTLLAFPRKFRLKMYRKTDKFIQKWNAKKTNCLFIYDVISDARLYFPASMFSEFVPVEFENRKYMCMADYDGYLKIQYGDYMRLPPEEERIYKHFLYLLDFENNYEDRNEQ